METLKGSASHFKDKGGMQWSDGFALLPGKKGWEEEKGLEGQCT